MQNGRKLPATRPEKGAAGLPTSKGTNAKSYYRPIVTPGVERKAPPIEATFLSSITLLVMTVVWLGMLIIRSRDEERRLALYGAAGSA
jgi:hypothetical protein